MNNMKTILKQIDEIQFAIAKHVTNEELYIKLDTLLSEVWDILHDGIYSGD
jgi:hypothetical protein